MASGRLLILPTWPEPASSGLTACVQAGVPLAHILRCLCICKEMRKPVPTGHNASQVATPPPGLITTNPILLGLVLDSQEPAELTPPAVPEQELQASHPTVPLVPSPGAACPRGPAEPGMVCHDDICGFSSGRDH